MPIASFKNIFCCSSEDKAHPACNLLTNTNKKWKCETAGLKSIFIILQFDKPTKINGIDIGNEHSAFIEVFVGKNGWTPENYQQILLTSSFMTPMESRNSTTTNRVRCFAANSLISPVCNEKWDLIKIMCTQPFNKHVQYGLSFIKIHCVDEDDKIALANSTAQKTKCETLLGLPSNNVFSQFTLREDSPDSDKECCSSLFSKWKQTKASAESGNSSKLSAAAAIRDASSSVTNFKNYETSVRKVPTITPKSKKEHAKPIHSKSDDDSCRNDIPIDRNRDSIMYDDDDVNTSIPKLEKMIDKDNERIHRENDKRHTKKLEPASKSESKVSSNRGSNNKMESSAKKFKNFLDSDQKTEVKTNNEIKLDTSVKLLNTRGSSQSKNTTPTKETKGNRMPNNLKRLSSSLDSTECDTPSKKKKTPNSNVAKELCYKPFGKLLEGVFFVISGIQNPERAEIRDKALKMGAKYKPDWDGICTHLICAFKNTPKYNQVHGHGKIVKRNWIIDCFSKRKRLPWRRYALDSNETKSPESEDEINDLAQKPFDGTACKTVENCDSSNEDVLQMYDLEVPKSQNVAFSGSESDDDIETKTLQKEKKSDKEEDIYEMDTDEDITNN